MTVPPIDHEKLTVLVYCQAIFGAGHWMQAAALAAALTNRFEVVLVSGGRLDAALPVPTGVKIERLPALEIETWSRLIAADSEASLEEVKRLRMEKLLSLLHKYRPAAIFTEYFPFCRHFLSDEYAVWLAAAKKLARRPLVLCSLRDILETRCKGRAEFNARVCELANRYFDAILYHSDPRWMQLKTTFSMVDRLRVPIVSTGFVTPAWDHRTRARDRGPRIVVSAGGSRGGEDLLFAAVGAQRTGGLSSDFSMRVFAGLNLPEPIWQQLCDAAAGVPRLELLRWSLDLRGELSAAAVSVSRCGYNTALDLLLTGVPALVVPYVSDVADEQLIRADALERLGLARVLANDQIDPENLAKEIRRTAEFRPRAAGFDFDGGRKTTEWLFESLSSPTPWEVTAIQLNSSEEEPIPRQPRCLPGEFWGITTFFNPANYTNKLTNLRRFSEGVRLQGLKLLIVELAFGDAPFVVDDSLADRVLRLRSTSILWHKERLINLGLAQLPAECDKVAWLDGDILFEDDEWLARTAERLESFVVVQPYQIACWLPKGLTWAPPEDFRFGVGEGRALHGLACGMATSPPVVRPPANAEYFEVGHTGFAWAARRELLDRHGLYDAMIVGAGDLVIGHVMFGGPEYWGRTNVHRLLLSRPQFDHLAEWGIPFARDVGGSVSYIPGARCTCGTAEVRTESTWRG